MNPMRCNKDVQFDYVTLCRVHCNKTIGFKTLALE